MLKHVLVAVAVLATACAALHAANKSFYVSADGSTLLRDGQPTRVLSGSFHYFRAPAAEWNARLAMMSAAGLNSVQTYIAWNFHCPTNKTSDCDFSGDRNISRFFELAQANNLQVMLRPGPYICAEWDLGGFPAWLSFAVGAQNLRTSNAAYLQYVRQWFAVLLPIIKPWLYINGGPIIMVQIENEYGMFGSDKVYLTTLRDIMRTALGQGTLLYSTDPWSTYFIANSAIQDVYQVVDFFSFGSTDLDVDGAWVDQHSQSKQGNSLPGPNFNDEFYPGWYTQFTNSVFRRQSIDYVVNITKRVLVNASDRSSLNFYMFFGGTNFAYWAAYLIATSYDYNAPINESGHASPMYAPVSAVLYEAGSTTPRLNGSIITTPPSTLPQPPPLFAYGTVTATMTASVWDKSVLTALTEKIAHSPAGAQPPQMEDVAQWSGYAMYEIVVNGSISSLSLNPRDYAVVSIDGAQVVGSVVRGYNSSITLPKATPTGTIWVLVESMGFINIWGGVSNNDFSKGVGTGGVQINGTAAAPHGYTYYGLPLSGAHLAKIPWKPLTAQSKTGPGTFYRTTFTLSCGAPKCGGTLVDVTPYYATGSGRFPFGKGLVFVNGHNLGRYWSTAGPQFVLFCPESYLYTDNRTTNVMVVFEQQASLGGRSPSVSFITTNLNH